MAKRMDGNPNQLELFSVDLTPADDADQTPFCFDPGIYRERNTVERGFNRLKHWRGIATRYDKYALTYLGGVTLAAIVIHHRTHLADRT